MPKAIFKIPSEDTILCIEGEWQKVQEIPDEFFICSIFNEGISGIAGSIRNLSDEDFDTFNSDVQMEPQQVSNEDYLADVESLILQMKNGDFDKVVYSRNYLAPSKKTCQEVFKKLCEAFPNRFTYLLIDDEDDIWLGTTPEIMLSGSKGNYTSMALAGTQENTGQELEWVQWGTKEIKEHQFVSDFIEDKIKRFSYVKDDIRTIDAGPVVHLQTLFRSILLPNQEVSTLLEQLNPTPAVCGYPYTASLGAILRTERYNRKYYTGLVGAVFNETMHIYVNLRSMRKCRHGYELFLGGGLTKDSSPEDEWKETELKAKTITQFI